MALLNVSRSFVSSVLAFFTIVLGFFTLLFTTSAYLTFSNGESGGGTVYADAPPDPNCSSCYYDCNASGCDSGCGCY